MEYKRFGKAGVKVSAMGMGTYFDPIPIFISKLFGWRRERRENFVKALRKGLELGINLIDTAEFYNNEEIIGSAIRDYNRESLFIASKVWVNHLSHDDLLKAAERSAKKLGTDYIDLYQIHYPSRKAPITSTMKAMEKLVDEGKIRFIGVSNFRLSQIKEVEEALSKHELAANQVEINLEVGEPTISVLPSAKDLFSLRAVRHITEADQLDYCERDGIALLAYRPLSGGRLAETVEKGEQVFDRISKAHGGKTRAQICLNWLLSRSELVFPIPRATRPTRIIENAGAVGWRLNPGERRELTEAMKRVLLTQNP